MEPASEVSGFGEVHGGAKEQKYAPRPMPDLSSEARLADHEVWMVAG